MTKLMQTDLLNAPFFVGLKQSTDAIKNGKAAKAFVANDADDQDRKSVV